MERFARLVAETLEVPVALVSLVEADRQVFPGQVGLAEPWQLGAVQRQTCLSRILPGGGLRSLSRVQGMRGVPRRDPQPQLRAACRSQVRQPGQFPGRPGSGLGVNRAEGTQHVAVGVGQRHAGVSGHPRFTGGLAIGRLLVLTRIGQYQGAAGGRHALAQRAHQRGLATGRPRLSQANLAGKDLPVRLHQRHQRYGYLQRFGHQPREPLHPRIRGRRPPAAPGPSADCAPRPIPLPSNGTAPRAR